MVLKVLVLSVVFGASWATDLRFPDNFKFGAASAAYQVEGAWNVSDKSESIWDRFMHTTPAEDGSTGDVACDSYHLYKEDVRVAAEMGLQSYRFSISWPRLLPNGFSNVVSKNGKEYYDNLINELLRNNIEPVVTLYHWDLPQSLQDFGGWINPLVTDWFADYADVAFSLFGDRVKTWITINEPIGICDLAYNAGNFRAFLGPDNAAYLCSKNAMIAHAKAFRIYDQKYRSLYGGQLSIANYGLWCEGDTEEDVALAELVMQHQIGRYFYPIFSKGGGWPLAIEEIIANKSKNEGLPRSRLPAFTKDEIEFIKGTADFIGLNYYTSALVRKPKPGEILKYDGFPDVPELGARITTRPEWPVNEAFLNYAVYPKGLRLMLNWLRNQYGNVRIMIAENGHATRGQTLNDTGRVQYLKEHMEQMLLAINEDKINVTEYIVWSLTDNFQWNNGFITKFGLYEVDFEDPKRKRTARKSAEFYASVIRNRALRADSPYQDFNISSA